MRPSKPRSGLEGYELADRGLDGKIDTGKRSCGERFRGGGGFVAVESWRCGGRKPMNMMILWQ